MVHSEVHSRAVKGRQGEILPPPPLPTYNNLQNCSCEKLKSGPKVGGGDAMAGITITFSRGYGFSSKLVSEFEKCPKGPIHPKFLGGGEREDAPIAF
jgi:hypothetical protein